VPFALPPFPWHRYNEGESVIENFSVVAGSDVGQRDLGAIVQLYGAAFPATERKPASFLTDALGRPDYRFICAYSTSGLIGFALVYRSAPAGVALLEYLAVHQDSRSRGCGGRLFQAALDAAESLPLLVEVERSVPTGEADMQIKRRLSFYRKLGCRKICGIEYHMPKVGDRDAPPMDLLICGFAEKTLDRDRLSGWIAAVYTGVYGLDVQGDLLRQVISDDRQQLRLY
jgi:GNAT superfamily N-acetyltransferase